MWYPTVKIPCLQCIYWHVECPILWLIHTKFYSSSYGNKSRRKKNKKSAEYVWRVESHPNDNVNIPLSYKKPTSVKKPVTGAAQRLESGSNPSEATLAKPQQPKQPKQASKKRPNHKKKSSIKATKVSYFSYAHASF